MWFMPIIIYKNTSPGTLKIKLAGITDVYEPADKPSTKSIFKRKISSSSESKKNVLDGRNSVSASGMFPSLFVREIRVLDCTFSLFLYVVFEF